MRRKEVEKEKKFHTLLLLIRYGSRDLEEDEEDTKRSFLESLVIISGELESIVMAGRSQKGNACDTIIPDEESVALIKDRFSSFLCVVA